MPKHPEHHCASLLGWVGGNFYNNFFFFAVVEHTKIVHLDTRCDAITEPARILSFNRVPVLRSRQSRGLACPSQSPPYNYSSVSLFVHNIAADLMPCIQQNELTATSVEDRPARYLPTQRRVSYGSMRWKHMGRHRCQCAKCTELRKRLPRQPPTATCTR